MSDGRRIETTSEYSEREREVYFLSSLLFSSPFLRDFPLSSPLIPPICVFFPQLALLSIALFAKRDLQCFFKKNSRYPSIPSPSARFKYREEIFRGYFEILLASRENLLLRWRKSRKRESERIVESQMQLDSWLYEENSVGWSIYCRFRRVHSKCIG